MQTRAFQGEMRLHTMVGSKLRNTAPLGYELRAQNAAALETNHPGKAWFSSSLDAATRADAACLFAGLLLYLPYRGLTNFPLSLLLSRAKTAP